MEYNVIFLVIIGFAGFAMIYFITRSNGKNSRISMLLKTHPEKIKVLLDVDIIPPIYSLVKDDINKILSLSDNDWHEWDELIKRVSKLGNLYPKTAYEIISEYTPKVKERIYYKKNISVFMPINKIVNVAIASMVLDELRIIDADSEETWKQRDKLRLLANKIKQKLPDGYKTYCEIHNSKDVQNIIIVKDKNQIAELQKIYDECKGYVGWEKKQEEFSSKYWQIIKDVRSKDGRYTYDVSFCKPNRRGSLEESKFTVWQGFCKSFSSYLLDRQTDDFKGNYNEVSEFKIRDRYFYDRVYDQIFDIINRFKEEIEGNLYVILIDRCKRNWPKDTYDYHYEHIRDVINESEIHSFNFSALPLLNDNGNIGGVFILDLITSNDELMKNCKLIIEHFNKSVPFIGYYSMIKEYDEEELLKLSEQHEGFLKPIVESVENENIPIFRDPFDDDEEEPEEDDDIKLIKQRISEVRKHPFFSYLAIPNTWIGEAADAEDTKEEWLNQPAKYHFRIVDEKGKIACQYSINGCNSYNYFSIDGDKTDIDDVARFTYYLFQKMGVMDEFRLKGHKAVEFINNNRLLAYH